MPRLCAARFESVGHRDARLDGLTLRFTGHDARPADSVLWLRNGGGKSSILNLIFSALRPSQREFLGSEADAGVRELIHYVAPDDTASVCLAWALDDGGGAAADEPPASTLLTGVAMQQVPGGAGLRRVYYSIRVDERPGGEPVTIDTLPLVAVRDGRRHVLRLPALKEALEALGAKPGVTVFTTEVQREWARQLARLQLDPEVFGYQIKMNRSEGVADEIFRFASAEAFADFVIEMVLPTSSADQVSENLQELRARLAERPRLELERGALEAAGAALEPAVALAEERAAERSRLFVASRTLELVEAAVAAGRDAREAAVAAADRLALDHEARFRDAEQRAERGRCEVAVLGAARSRLELAAREADAAGAEAAERALERRARVLAVAETLGEARAARAEAAALRADLDRRLASSRPQLEELRRAAAALRSALTRELAALEARARAAAEAQDDVAAQVEAEEASIRDAATELGRLDERIAAARSAETRLEALRAGLEARDLLEPGERLDDAVARLETRVAALSADRLAQARALAEGEARLVAGLEAAATARRRAEAALESAAAVEAALDDARASYLELSRDPALAAALEDEAPDLLRLGVGAVAQLTRRLASLREAMLGERVEVEAERRALEWLERHGVLPPSTDAERVQRALAEAGIGATSGGEFLAARADAGAAERAARAHPELAAGVIVEAGSLDSAEAALERAAVEVSSPVAVATAAALGAAGVEAAVVVLPPRASYDREAAGPELERRRARARDRSARLERLASEVSGLERVRAALAALIDRRPAAWVERQEALLAQRRDEAEAWRGEALEREREAAEAAEAIEDTRGRIAATDEARRAADLALAELRAAAGAGEIEARREEISRLEEAREAAVAAQEQRRRRLAELQGRARALQRQVVALAAERAPLERELAGVEADATDAGAGAAPGEGVALPVARRLHEVSRRAYEQRTAAEGSLAAHLEAVEARARELEQKVEARLARDGALPEAVFGRSDVEAALDEALAGPGLEAAAARVDEELGEARRAVARARSAVILAERDAAERGRAVQAIADEGGARLVARLRREAEGRSAGAIDVELERARRELEAARQEAADAAAERAAARAAAAEARAGLQRLGDWARRLADARRAFPLAPGDVAALEASLGPDALLLPAAGQPLEPGEAVIETLGEWVEAAVTGAGEAGARFRAVEARVRAAAQALESFAVDPGAEALPAVIRDRLREGVKDLDVLLARARTLLDDVRVRGLAIAAELAQVDQHRRLIAAGLERATDRAIEILGALEHASLFPAGVPSWGGVPFLKVKVRTPPTAPERHAIAEALIDRVVQQRDVPSGLRLVQAMVRELVRGGGLAIQVLKPDVHRRREHVPISSLGAFSGGERLTAAILLYCTLAHMRAQRRGAARAPTSVLVLDNPVGACSHPELLELQRDMARSHGVQLVYTTGVEDLEALARLPNVLRLRNAHADLRGRRRVSCEARPIEVARVARADPEPARDAAEPKAAA